MTSSAAALRLTLATFLLALASVPVSVGCGGESTAAPDSPTARQAGQKAKSRAATARDCPKQLAAFVDSLDALRRQLAVGLAYEQYVARVKGLRTSYREIPVDRLTIECLARGTPSEKALNKHIDAANAWGECLADATCTTAKIEPVLQRRWRVASRYLSEAR